MVRQWGIPEIWLTECLAGLRGVTGTRGLEPKTLQCFSLQGPTHDSCKTCFLRSAYLLQYIYDDNKLWTEKTSVFSVGIWYRWCLGSKGVTTETGQVKGELVSFVVFHFRCQSPLFVQTIVLGQKGPVNLSPLVSVVRVWVWKELMVLLCF